MFIVASVTIAKMWEQPCLSRDKWVKKTWCLHKIEYYSAVELKEILPFEMESHYAEWNKPDGERQTLYDVIYMWNLKNVELKETD